MRRDSTRLLGVARLCCSGVLVACSSGAAGGAGAATAGDGGGDETVGASLGLQDGDVGSATDATSAAAGPGLRVAQLSPDLLPIDVCLAPHGTTRFTGPLIGQIAGGDAGASGLTYAQVSAYIPVEPGQYDVLVVPAGLTSCFPVPVVAELPPWAATGPATLVIAGEASPMGGDKGLEFAVVADDGQLAGGAASLRAINAMPALGSMNLDLGAFGTKWTTLLANVTFGEASTQSGPNNEAVDSNGYLPIPPLSGATLSAASSYASADLAVATSVSVPVGSIATVIAIGRAGDPAHPPALLLCTDNEPSAGLLSDCSVAQ